MIEPRLGWGLSRTFAALYRARRVLNEQAIRPPWGTASFNDNLPWILDSALNVRRTLHTETEEMRSRNADHERWWASILRDEEFLTLRDLRNIEVKEWRRVTSEHVALPVGVEVVGAISKATDEHGREECYEMDFVGSLPAGSKIRHEFTVEPWAGRAVLPCLKRVLHRLEFDVMPIARDFTAQWGPAGRDLPSIGASEPSNSPAFLQDAWCEVLEPEGAALRWAYTLIQPGESEPAVDHIS